MGSELVQDPWWGNFATNLANSVRNAPKQALDQTMTVEQIWALREKRARDTEIWNEGKKAADLYPAAVPEATVPPSIKVVPGPWNPDDPNTVMPAPDAPDALPTQSRQFIDPRALAAAEARRNLAIAGGRATILKDPSQTPAQQAYGQVMATGVPTDPREQNRLQFQTTGRFRTSDESKTPNAQNFVIVNPDGTSTGQGFSSLNGGRTTIEGAQVRLKPGERIMETGPAPLAKPNPIENQQVAQNGFNELAAKIQAKIARGEPISNAELNAARAMRDVGWGKKLRFDTDPETGRSRHTPHYDVLPPKAGPSAELFAILNDIDGVPADAAGALVDDATLTGAGDPKPVVADYLRMPVINSYENAKSGYSTFIGNLPLNNQTSDLALIIGAAKILDPPSVVREGEVENVRKTGSPFDQFIGLMQGLKGEARLPPAVRMQLWNMVNETMATRTRDVQPIHEQHSVQLRDRKVDPNKYLPPLQTLRAVDAAYMNTRSGRTDSTGKTVPETKPAAAATTTAPAATTQEQRDRLRQKLGQ